MSNFFFSVQMYKIKIRVHVSQHYAVGSRKCVTKTFRKHVADGKCSINSNYYFDVDNYTDMIVLLLFLPPFSLLVSLIFSLIFFFLVWNFLSPYFSYSLISLNEICSYQALLGQALCMTQNLLKSLGTIVNGQSDCRLMS